MRRSTAIILGLMLAGFGALFFAAQTALKPLARDAEVSRTLTRDFLDRAAIEPETKVRAIRVPGSSKRLTPEGLGLLVHAAPRAGGLAADGSLAALATALADRALALYPAGRLDWVEVVFELGEERERRTLVRVAADGTLLEPQPTPDA